MNALSHCVEYAVFTNTRQLTNLEQRLYAVAQEAKENAYAPYSSYRVGSALALQNGEIVYGSNQENASYPCGICAERAALHRAHDSFPDVTIEIALVLTTKSNKDHPAAPCGFCRQVLLEFENKQASPIRLILVNHTGHGVIFSSISDILPFGFEKENLHISDARA